MGFFGDLFLPKHLFRTADKLTQGGLPEKDENGKRQFKKAAEEIKNQALMSSQVIGARLWPELGKKKIRFFGELTWAGVIVFGIWLVFVLSVFLFGVSRIVHGIDKAGQESRRQYNEKKKSDALKQQPGSLGDPNAK